jgi:hypothetical protein
LLVDQPRVRASLLKQYLQDATKGTFDETRYGDESFRHFLERHSHLLTVQQKGTTLLVSRAEATAEPHELHLHYRSELKKRGLRVVPSEPRLMILKDVINLLQQRPQVKWRQLVDQIGAHYQRAGNDTISKSHVNDVLRLARRAEVINAESSGNLANAPVSLRLESNRLFQDAVIACDVAYLNEIQALPVPFDIEEASIALYESAGHSRYLKVILQRFSKNGQAKS